MSQKKHCRWVGVHGSKTKIAFNKNRVVLIEKRSDSVVRVHMNVRGLYADIAMTYEDALLLFTDIPEGDLQDGKDLPDGT